MPINVASICGNLTRDAELRVGKNGTPVLNFTVAVNNRRQNKATGEWESDPAFIPCVMFGNRAEKIAPYLGKGNRVTVSGKIVESRWEKDGQKRSKLQLVINEVDFQRSGGAQSYQQGQYNNSPQQYQSDQYDNAPQQYQPQQYPDYQQGRLAGSDYSSAY